MIYNSVAWKAAMTDEMATCIDTHFGLYAYIYIYIS